MVDTNVYLHRLQTIEFAKENADNFTRDVMSAAKTANPDMVTKGTLWGNNVNTTRADLEKMDQLLAGQANFSARVAFHAKIGNGEQISSDDKGLPVFPAINEQNVAAFNQLLETTNGTHQSFANAEPLPSQEAQMQPASDTKEKGWIESQREQYQKAYDNRIERAMGNNPQTSIKSCDFDPADLNTLSPSCPKGPSSGRELS